jgi:hypothetical protein
MNRFNDGEASGIAGKAMLDGTQKAYPDDLSPEFAKLPNTGRAVPPTKAEALAELRNAVEGGLDMPWSMVGIKWETARALLNILEVKND